MSDCKWHTGTINKTCKLNIVYDTFDEYPCNNAPDVGNRILGLSKKYPTKESVEAWVNPCRFFKKGDFPLSFEDDREFFQSSVLKNQTTNYLRTPNGTRCCKCGVMGTHYLVDSNPPLFLQDEGWMCGDCIEKNDLCKVSLIIRCDGKVTSVETKMTEEKFDFIKRMAEVSSFFEQIIGRWGFKYGVTFTILRD